MIRRKTLRRLRHIFSLALLALVINLTFPAHAHAAPAKPRSDPSHAVIAQLVVKPAIGLPSIAERPARQRLTVRASAYSSTRDQTDNDPFTTASGTKVHIGTVACNGLPFGTKIRIPDYFGDQVFTVEDRMNQKWGNKRIDIWMTTRAQAKNWGVRTVTIEII
jgi:3D (Asp-Asp-Asp) domain-containing protein